jgi:hypothetical protein
MTFSFISRLGKNTCNIFNRFYTPSGSTSYTPTWKNDPSTWTRSITGATSLINMAYMWIQPTSKSSMTSQPQPHSLSFKASWALPISTTGSCWASPILHGPSQQKTFDDLKQCLCSAPVLSLPDLQQPFEIETNASDYDVGTVLTQHNPPVAYHSEALSDVVSRHPTYDKEMYSIVQACRKWRHYILGKETIIHTDHKPL